MTKFERAMLFNCPACRARVSGRVVGMVEVQPQLKTPEELEEMILDPARTALVGAWWGRLGGDGLVGTARMFPVSSRIRNLRSKPETCRLSLEFPSLEFPLEFPGVRGRIKARNMRAVPGLFPRVLPPGFFGFFLGVLFLM